MDLPVIVKKGPYGMELEPGEYKWCSCGLSKIQPFCDSAHKGTGFHSVRFKVTEKKLVWLCGCKKTTNPPYCDGTHKRLRDE